MNIDRMEFLAWMERIIERMDMLTDNIDSLQKKSNSIDGEELLDNQDLLQMLKISNKLLLTTLTLLRAIAAPAIIGFSRKPFTG